MGAAASHFRRVFQNWNVENRAFRAIGREHRLAPPRYPTEEKRIAQGLSEKSIARTEIPGLEDEKSVDLDNRLKQIKIEARGSSYLGGPVEHDPRAPVHPLPQERGPVFLDEFGYFKPVRIPPGKISMGLALKFLSTYQQNPEAFTMKELSSQYKLMEEDATALARHFRVFALYIPEIKDRKSELIDLKTLFGAPKEFSSAGESKAYQEGGFFHAHYVAEVEKRRIEDEKTEIEEGKIKEAGKKLSLPLKSDVESDPIDIGAKDPEERLRALDRKKR